jgi:hypothetical protein
MGSTFGVRGLKLINPALHTPARVLDGTLSVLQPVRCNIDRGGGGLDPPSIRRGADAAGEGRGARFCKLSVAVLWRDDPAGLKLLL